MSNVNRTFLDNEPNYPFNEELVDELTYTDGTSFDVRNEESYLGTKIFRGPCFALDQNSDLAMRDFKCSRESGFICSWQG